MKILVVCQYYYPEPFRITDICEELVRSGNEVVVITGTPNYPMGEIYQGYEKQARQDEVINGVKVHRCDIHPRKTGAVHRLWNYYSYAYKSSKYVNKLDSSFDVVFINQLSPVMMAKAGIRYAKKNNIKAVLYCLDLWPASLSAGGMNGGLVYRWFHRESKKVYQAVNKILISSKSFAEYFEKQFDINETEYLPQYAEESFSPEECRKEANEFIDLMFAGNVGSAQNVECIIKTAANCKDILNLRWHIVGDGKELNSCKKLANELKAPVIFHGRKPLDEMPQYYSMADAMLVTMKNDPVVGLTLPGKVQSYMAAGKFIIGTDYGELAEVIKGCECGLCCDTNNIDAFSDCIRKFVELDIKSRLEIEKNSHINYVSRFGKKKFFETLTNFMM